VSSEGHNLMSPDTDTLFSRIVQALPAARIPSCRMSMSAAQPVPASIVPDSYRYMVAATFSPMGRFRLRDMCNSILALD
jgi:hypothetical protein